MREQEVNSTSSAESFANKIIEILGDSEAFTNKKESEIKKTLVSVYRDFAKEYGFDSINIDAWGMRDGLEALCNYPPRDYLVRGSDQPMLEIWIGHPWKDRSKTTSFKRVIIRVEDSHFDAGEKLKKLISLTDGNIEITIQGAKQYRELLEEFRGQYIATVRESYPH